MKSAIFITFSGNCSDALTFYQSCFGGRLQFETVKIGTDIHIVTGSLTADTIAIYGSDLVHDEGRQTGNHLAILLQCETADEKRRLIKKLAPRMNDGKIESEFALTEIIDRFAVRWILTI